MIGVGANGIAFGNLSVRERGTNRFYITGSGTGALPELGLEDYAKVTAFDFTPELAALRRQHDGLRGITDACRGLSGRRRS